MKIVVAGDATSSSFYAVASYNSDGSLDTSFNPGGLLPPGTAGKVTTDVNTSEYGYGVAIQDDGKIVVVGSVWYVPTQRDWIVIRYNPDGSPDNTFNPGGALPPGTAGMVAIDFATNTDEAKAVAIQDDGKIVVAGHADTDPTATIDYDFAVVRLNANGSLDTTFSGDGKVTTEFGTEDAAQANGVAIQDDGKIVVVGNSGLDFAVARYNTDGALDNSFSVDGKVVTDFMIDWDIAYDVAIQDDGKIVVSGYATIGNQNWGIARYNSNGTLDTSFGTDPILGRVVTDTGATSEIGYGVAIQTDGKIVVGGNRGQDFAVARYNSDGSLDTAAFNPTGAFGGSPNDPGMVTTDFDSGSNDAGYGLAIQTDGKIVVGGWSASDFGVVRYNTDGSLDTSFGTGGKVTTDFLGATDIGRAIAIVGTVECESQDWWDPAYAYRKQLDIDAAVSGYSMKLELTGTDAANIYSKSLASGDDFRVVWYNGCNWIDLDRHLESFASDNITVWFRIQEPGGWGGGPSNYYLYYGNSTPDPVKADNSKVYDLWDDFINTNNWTPFTEQGYSAPRTAFVDGGSELIFGTGKTLATLSTPFPTGNNFVIAIVQLSCISTGSITAGSLYLERDGGSPQLMKNKFQIDIPNTAPNNKKWYALMGIDPSAPANVKYNVKASASGSITGEAKILAINGVTGLENETGAAGLSINSDSSNPTQLARVSMTNADPAADYIVLGIFETHNGSAAVENVWVHIKRGEISSPPGTLRAMSQFALYHNKKSEVYDDFQVHLIPFLEQTEDPGVDPDYFLTAYASVNNKVDGWGKIVVLDRGSLSAAYDTGSTGISSAEVTIATLSTTFTAGNDVAVIASEQFKSSSASTRYISAGNNKLQQNGDTGTQTTNQYDLAFNPTGVGDDGKGFGLLNRYTGIPASPTYRVRATADAASISGESKILAIMVPPATPLPSISIVGDNLKVSHTGTMKHGVFHNSFSTSNANAFATRTRSSKTGATYHGVAGWYHTQDQYGPAAAGAHFYAAQTSTGQTPRNRYVLSIGTDSDGDTTVASDSTNPLPDATPHIYETIVKTDGAMKFTRDDVTEVLPPGPGYTTGNATRTSGRICIVGQGANDDAYYDWIAVRKFTDSEPSVTALSEETPTAVDLVDFRATGNGSAVRVSWETAQEIDNLGFNLYRSTAKDAPYQKLNPSLIPGLLYSVTGKKYTYDDANVIKGQLYYYKLEDIDSAGRHTWHGPVCVDWDGDGIPDDWEIAHGLDPTANDGNFDYDNDGLTNYEEYLRGTDPFNPDTDGDGIPDGQEAGKLPTTPGGAATGDGITVVSQDETGMVLELVTSRFDSTDIEEAGTTYQRLTIPGYTHGLTEKVGHPELPIKGYWVDLPQGMGFELVVEKVETEASSGYLVYPVPQKIALEEEVIEEFSLDPQAYALNDFTPTERVTKGTVAYLRDQKKAQVLFSPLSFNPHSGELGLHTIIRVRISFIPDQGSELQAFGFRTAPFGLAAADPDWPPAGSEHYKITTTEEGIYRITAGELEAAGVDIYAIDPRSLHLYNQGAEVAMYVFGERDGLLDPTDYLLFYAEPINTKYTRTNVYWLVVDDSSAGLRMGEIDGTPPTGGLPLASFTATLRHEPEEFYWGKAPGPDELDRWFSTQLIWGGSSLTLPLPVDGPAGSGQAQVQISLWGYYEVGERRITATLDGQMIGQAQWQGQRPVLLEGTVDQAQLSNWTLTIQSDGPPLDLVIVDWTEIHYQRTFAATGDSLKFSSDPGYLFEISGFTENALSAFDITDPLEVSLIQGIEITAGAGSSTLRFQDNGGIGEHTYIALGDSRMKTAQGITQLTPPDLKSTANGADYILITHRAIGWDEVGTPYDWLRDLVEYRQSQGLRVVAVDVDQIYDAFNYGISDPQAVKDFLGYAYHTWQPPAPRYVLLVGDGTRDPKGNRSAPGPGVPTYLGWTRYMGETAIDDWFVQIVGDDALGDLSLGRLPAADNAQAQVMVTKIISYEETPTDEPWQKRLLLIADDGEPIFEQMNEAVSALIPAQYSLIKGYLSEYTVSPNIPQDLTDEIIAEINQGILIVNYVGHGGSQFWAHEKIFDAIRDIPMLSNDQRLPVMALMTCFNGNFIAPQRSLAEEMLLVDGTGAVAAFASTGMTDAQIQKLLDQGFVEAIFQQGIVRLGEAVAVAKQTLLANSTEEQDTANSFSLMGDPAMTLAVEPQSSSPVVDAGGGGGGGCFVASAAYGSFLDHHVNALRSFRDTMLIPSAVGGWLVRAYYTVSPPAAHWIKGHENIRTLTRITLAPLVATAQIDLDLALVICLFLLLITSPLAWMHWLKERKGRHDLHDGPIHTMEPTYEEEAE